MKNLVVDPERFEIVKADYLQTLRNYNMSQPYQHAAMMSQNCLRGQAWDIDELRPALESVTDPAAVVVHMQRLLSSFHVDCFVHGNMEAKEALVLGDIIKHGLEYTPLPVAQLPTPRVVQLLPGHTYYSHHRVRNLQDTNSAIVNSYHIGEYTIPLGTPVDALPYIQRAIF